VKDHPSFRVRRVVTLDPFLRTLNGVALAKRAALVSCLVLTGCAEYTSHPPAPGVAGRESRMSASRLIPGPRDTTMRLPWVKLLVRDERERVLLVRWKSEYEVPGTELSASAAIDEDSCGRFLDDFASDLGMKIRTPRLAAEVLQHFAGRNRPVPFRWYEVRLTEGIGRRPAGEPDIDQVAWMSLDEAITAIPYPAAHRILKQIAQWPDRTIQGEYEVDYSVNPPAGSLRIIHDFSPEAPPGR